MGKVIFSLCVSPHLDGGGVGGLGVGPRSQIFRGGVPSLRFSGGGGGPRSREKFLTPDLA